MAIEIYGPINGLSGSIQDELGQVKKWFSETLHRVAGFDGEPHETSGAEKLKCVWMDCNADPIEDYLPLKLPLAARSFYRRNAVILPRWENAGRHGVHFFVVNAKFLARNALSVHVIWDDWFFSVTPP